MLQESKQIPDKVTKDIEELDNVVCYACGLKSQEDKKKEIEDKKAKELEDVTSQKEITDKLDIANKELDDIGDINGRPKHFMKLLKKFMIINKMLHN